MIGQHDVSQLFDRLGWQAVQCVLDNNRDISETNAPTEKGLHRYFIGGIERRTGRTPSIKSFAGQSQAGETQGIRSLKVQASGQQQVQRADAGVDTFRPGQSMGYWCSHVRV